MLNLKTDRVAFSGRRGCQGGAGARGRGARGRFGAIGRSSTRTSFSLGLVSFRSASKVRAESVRSGPLGKSASATSTSPKLTGEKTWGRWKETKRRQSICARGCRRRTRAWGAEVPDTSRRVEDLMHMGRR